MPQATSVAADTARRSASVVSRVVVMAVRHLRSIKFNSAADSFGVVAGGVSVGRGG